MLAQASLLKNLASMRRFCKEHGLFPLPECLQVAGDTRTVSTQSAPDLQHVPDGADSHDIRTEFSSFSGRSSQQRLQGLPNSAQVTGCQTICGHVIKNPKPTGATRVTRARKAHKDGAAPYSCLPPPSISVCLRWLPEPLLCGNQNPPLTKKEAQETTQDA